LFLTAVRKGNRWHVVLAFSGDHYERPLGFSFLERKFVR
jgi:hypothetical protein